jgi:SAM-dependent methyltransferase
VRSAEEHVANDPRSELWGEHRARYRFAVGLAGSERCRVLDVACGAGFGLHMLRQAGARTLGLDLNPHALAEARRLDPAAPVARADAACLPLADRSFDLAVSFETLEHVPDASALVRELRRVLRPTGRLVLSTPNRLFGPPELHRNPFHVREFSGDELGTLLHTCFERVELFGQRPVAAYRQVPFLLLPGQRRLDPATLSWKLLNRLPFELKDALARALTGRPFYPGEHHYRFVPGRWQSAHTLLAVARP